MVNKTKEIQVECPHSRKSGTFYAYNLIGSTLYLCPKCEKKLRKEILNQIKIEEDLKNGK